MSNQAYILYLQGVVSANSAKQTGNGYTIDGLQTMIANATAQIATYQASIDSLNAENSQLTADNVLLGNLIQQLQASK